MLKKQRPVVAAVILGIASGFKLYPLLFVPFLFLSGRNLKEKIILVLIPVLTFGVIILPFISTAFFQSALVSGLTTGIFTSNFSTLAVAVLFFYSVLVDKKINLFNYWIALFLIIFSFTLFHVQWLLWIAPFLVILAVRKPNFSWLLFAFGILAFAIPFLYQDRFMTISLYRIYSTWFDLLPTPFTLIQRVYDPINLQAVIQSILAGGSLVLIYRIFKEKDI
jgi:hypothetical protein